MTYDPGPPPITKETMLIGQHIAYLIRTSPDEKRALRSICRFLNHWKVEINPSDLSSRFQDR